MTDLEEWWQQHHWYVLAVFWVVVLFFAFWGLQDYLITQSFGRGDQAFRPDLADILYEIPHLFTFDGLEIGQRKSWPLQIARFAAPLLLFLTTIDVIAFQKIRPRFFRNHVVVVGAGLWGRLLAEHFRKEGRRVVVVDQDESASFGFSFVHRGIPIFLGNAKDPSTLSLVGVQRADILACITDDDITNAEIVFTLQEFVKTSRKWSLDILIHVLDCRLYRILHELELERSTASSSRFHFFNLYDRAAHLLIEESDPLKETCGRTPSLLVVGFGPLSQSFLVRTAQKWQGREDRRFKITVVDGDAKERLKAFSIRYPAFDRRCELQGVSAAPGSPGFEEASFLSGEGTAFTKAYVLLESDSAALAAALVLWERLNGYPLPIVLALERKSTFLPSNRITLKPRGGIEVIGLLDHILKPDLLLGNGNELLAEQIHEKYLMDQQQKGFILGTTPLLQPWNLLLEEYKDCNRNQADHIGEKLEIVGCELDSRNDWDSPLFQFTQPEIERLAEIEHERWMEERAAKGWTFEPERDEVRKTHPDMVPWEKLSEEARDKDRNAVRHIPALVAKVGFDIRRKPQ